MSRKEDKVNKLKSKFSLKNTKSLEEATEIVKQISISKFDGSVDIDIVLNLKDKDKKESIKGTVLFPHAFQSDINIVALCEENLIDAAKKAGAIDAGLDNVVKKLEESKLDFDLVLATPNVMGKIAKLGKVLGPKGLMPSPKNGTITNDLEKTIKEFKAGKTSYKSEQKQGVIRTKIGKVTMESTQIKENIQTIIKEVINDTKKFGANVIKKVTLSPTMGPGVKVDVNDIIANI